VLAADRRRIVIRRARQAGTSGGHVRQARGRVLAADRRRIVIRRARPAGTSGGHVRRARQAGASGRHVAGCWPPTAAGL